MSAEACLGFQVLASGMLLEEMIKAKYSGREKEPLGWEGDSSLKVDEKRKSERYPQSFR